MNRHTREKKMSSSISSQHLTHDWGEINPNNFPHGDDTKVLKKFDVDRRMFIITGQTRLIIKWPLIARSSLKLPLILLLLNSLTFDPRGNGGES